MKHNFEITHDKEFLYRFMDKREVLQLSPEMVERLHSSNDPYGLYGYGQWLYAKHKDKASLLLAYRCFSIAAENGVADAYHMLSRMCRKGHIVSEESDLFKLDNELGDYFAKKAKAAGSQLAKLEINIDEYFRGTAKDKKKAIKDAKEECGKESASILWTEQLGWFYDAEKRNDEAIACYEKCIEEGLYYPIYDLAKIYYDRGNIAYHDSLMEEGIEKGVPKCLLYGYENLEVWDELSESQRDEIHKQMDVNLRHGVELGCSECAYLLSYCLSEGVLGFEQDLPSAVRYAREGIELGSHICCEMLLLIMENEDAATLLPADMLMTDDEKKMIKLFSLRYGNNDVIDEVVACTNDYQRMGYGDEIEKVWMPIWARHSCWGEDDDEEEKAVNHVKPVETKQPTTITPRVIVLKPSGMVSFVEADVYSMSYREMAEIIDAEGLDAVHHSAPLEGIKNSCGLKKQLAMYVDRNGFAKGLADNAAGTMLYGNGYEIRGSAIIVMEDHRYDTHSFDTLEDIEAVYNEINEFTGGLLRRE